MAKALDFGNFTDIPTPEQVRCWLSQGYTKAIIGTSFGPVWQQQIAVCEANGMDVEEYQFVRHLVPTTRRWWLDVELGEKEAQIRAAVLSASPYGIYTRKNIWDALDWDIVAEFPQLKLWDAAYADPPRPFVSYGGWTSRAMHQWHDSTLLCDLLVDLNIVEEVEEDEDMKPMVVWCPDYAGGSAWLVGPFGAAWVTQPDDLAALERLYGAITVSLHAATINGIDAR